jgi:1-acyl-sn-glycerol-3-phosphate acyltransferase
MSEAFAQVHMTPVYGMSHYWLRVSYDMFFRGTSAGLEHLPKTGPFLIAGNHASLLDPPLIGSQVPRQMSFFARKTLWKGRLFPWWLDAVGTIPVDRDGGQDVSALKRVLRSLADGKVMILFPEGTRSPDGRLQEPKAGVGLILCKTQVPVVPARIFGSFEAYGRGTKFPQLGTQVDVVFGPPLAPAAYDVGTGKERYQAASEQVMAAIARLRVPEAVVI